MTSSETDRELEGELGSHFARMRTEDSLDLPPFPDYAEQAIHQSAHAGPGGRSRALRISLAAAVLLAVGILATRQTPTEDPAALYAEVMNNYALETDELLSVSDGTSPGLMELPELVTPGLPGNIDKLAN